MASSDVLSGAAQGGMAGGAAGAKAGPWGAAIGAIVGSIGGAIIGGKKKKKKVPSFASGAVYGYDTYGNLVNRGSFVYNPQTGQYELKSGELSQQEKSMRQNLANNISGLINTVGTTPEAFVRYAKELSNAYYQQGERKLTEQYEKAQSRLDESLARRGMSTSRAAADLTSELQGKRFDTLADIYNASQQYGLSAQNQMQNQALSSFGALTGYQGQLSDLDKSYLSMALQAQQLGQQYENMKAGMQNKLIEEENQKWQNLLDAGTSLGQMFGYKGGSTSK